MPGPEPVELVLTCSNRAEAETIADALLEQRLIICAKFVPVESRYRWQNRIETGQEVLLLMESVASNFDKVETAVTKLHSYDTFVLKQIPINNLSTKAQKWWLEATNSKD